MQQKPLHPLRLALDVVRLGSPPRREVRPWQEGSRLQCGADRLVVQGIDEDAGLGRHELGWASDACCNDRPAGGETLERREPERLGDAGLADHVGCADPACDAVVADRALDVNSGPTLQRRS